MPAEEMAKNLGLEVVPGVELSADLNNIEIHILGLFIDYKQPWFIEKLTQIRGARFTRMEKMVEKLNAEGINISMEDVLNLSRKGCSLGRLHLARALFDKGFIFSVRQAFENYIGRNKPCYVKRFNISPQEAIKIILDLKGVPVLAHPGSMFHDEIIPELANTGLKAIEIYHSDHSPDTVKRYQKLAKKFNLLISGGSDCHGMGKGYPLIGMTKVPYEEFEKLKKSIS
ncbi:MAG: PHP domain-containing protein [Candidatus Omnitrophica bacterium]|nr:PHP domain-containing protein [Candidatus Omnitrophota bacterium]